MYNEIIEFIPIIPKGVVFVNYIVESSARIPVWTYGVSDGTTSTFGKIYVVPEDWLHRIVKQFGYTDIPDFQSAYTWDESKEILSIAEREGVVFEECDLSLCNKATY